MTSNVIQYFKLLEDKRANQARESLTAQEIQVKQREQEEFVRHNVAVESNASLQTGEQQRHNIAAENIAAREANIKAAELGIKSNQAWTQRMEFHETQRHNTEIEKQGNTKNISSLVTGGLKDLITFGKLLITK